MQARIGKQLIKTLVSQAKPYEVRDTHFKGFILRVQPSGVMSYVYEYTRGKRITLGKVNAFQSPDQARDKAKEYLADFLSGNDPAILKKSVKAHNFSAYITNVYEPWFKANRKSSKTTLTTLKIKFPELNSKKLSEITVLTVERWQTARLKQVKPATVNRELVCLKAALSKAIEWGLIKEHPLKAVKKSKEDRLAKVRYLSLDEEKCLRTALYERDERIRLERVKANQWRKDRNYDLLPDFGKVTYVDHLYPMVLLAVNTGLRRGELFNLQWQDIDFDQKNLTVVGETTKSGSTRHVPLNDEAFKVLKDWYKQAEFELVFPNANGQRLDNIKTSWGNLLRQAKIDSFRFHDLRHHFASRLVMSGVDLNTVRELLGHSDLKMTLRYAHLAPEHKAAAVAKLNGG